MIINYYTHYISYIYIYTYVYNLSTCTEARTFLCYPSSYPFLPSLSLNREKLVASKPKDLHVSAPNNCRVSGMDIATPGFYVSVAIQIFPTETSLQTSCWNGSEVVWTTDKHLPCRGEIYSPSIYH